MISDGHKGGASLWPETLCGSGARTWADEDQYTYQTGG